MKNWKKQNSKVFGDIKPWVNIKLEIRVGQKDPKYINISTDPIRNRFKVIFSVLNENCKTLFTLVSISWTLVSDFPVTAVTL